MIKHIAAYLPFETRLGQVLPYVAKIFDSEDGDSGATAKSQSQSAHGQAKTKVVGLDVLLSLFSDLAGRTDEILVEPFDFKVFQNYLMPIIKRLMDSSQGDSIVRYALAKKLAEIAKVGASLLEVA